MVRNATLQCANGAKCVRQGPKRPDELDEEDGNGKERIALLSRGLQRTIAVTFSPVQAGTTVGPNAAGNASRMPLRVGNVKNQPRLADGERYREQVTTDVRLIEKKYV